MAGEKGSSRGRRRGRDTVSPDDLGVTGEAAVTPPGSEPSPATPSDAGERTLVHLGPAEGAPADESVRRFRLVVVDGPAAGAERESSGQVAAPRSLGSTHASTMTR
jgi:hypothetical protein